MTRKILDTFNWRLWVPETLLILVYGPALSAGEYSYSMYIVHRTNVSTYRTENWDLIEHNAAISGLFPDVQYNP